MGIWHGLGIAGGVAVVACGVWLLWLSRRSIRGDGLPDPSAATRLTLALTICFLGYHLGIWSVPPGIWAPIGIPLERWWVVALVGVLAPLGAWGAEALERRGDGA